MEVELIVNRPFNQVPWKIGDVLYSEKDHMEWVCVEITVDTICFAWIRPDGTLNEYEYGFSITEHVEAPRVHRPGAGMAYVKNLFKETW